MYTPVLTTRRHGKFGSISIYKTWINTELPLLVIENQIVAAITPKSNSLGLPVELKLRQEHIGGVEDEVERL